MTITVEYLFLRKDFSVNDLELGKQSGIPVKGHGTVTHILLNLATVSA